MQKLFLWFAISSVFFSCRKEPDSIVDNSLNVSCLPVVRGSGEFVIHNDSTYQKTFNDPNYPPCNLPVVDFSRHTVLGLYGSGGCRVGFEGTVERVDNDKRYHYKLIVTSKGYCKSLGFSYNWVLVPKLPDGWRVTFEVIEK